MARLTNSMRDHIVDAALDVAGIPAAEKALNERKFDWAERARVHILGGDASAAMYAKINADAEKTADALPDDLRYGYRLVQCSSTLLVNLAGANLRVPMRDHVVAPTRRRSIEGDSPIVSDFYALMDEERVLKSRREDLRSNVLATVSRFNTTAQLVAAWPEAEALLPKAKKEQSKALTVPIEKLNTLIGLPQPSRA